MSTGKVHFLQHQGEAGKYCIILSIRKKKGDDIPAKIIPYNTENLQNDPDRNLFEAKSNEAT